MMLRKYNIDKEKVLKYGWTNEKNFLTVIDTSSEESVKYSEMN